MNPVAFLRHRIREPAFWRVQGLVAVVTAIHVLLDRPLLGSDPSELTASIRHIPVILYVAPVAYAGLAYGFEGGVLTGLWSSLLATPNIVIWHRAEYGWVGEGFRLLIVVSVGAVMALPVERERRQRQRAEGTAHRLALLNETAGAAARSRDLDTMVGLVLDRLREVMGLQAACATLSSPDDQELLLRECDEPCPLGPNRLSVPLVAGDATGDLSVLPEDGGRLSPEDRELLAAVAAQLGVAVENALLHRQEREQLESYVKLVTQAQEEERARIARDLHDDAAQRLAVLCRTLDDLNDARPANGPAPGDLEAVRDLARDTLTGLRGLVRDLRPAMLDDLGLVPAIEWLVSGVGERSGLVTDFVVDGEPRRLRPGTEVALFRIAQEALRNVEHHAAAGRVEVAASFRNGTVTLRVADDGRGFALPLDRSELVPSGRLGVLGMHERAELVGGRLRIRSTPGSGTAVEVQVPT